MVLKETVEVIERILVKATTVIATVCLSTICITILLQVFFRRVLNSPIIWAEDLAVFLFIWVTFLGAAVLFQKKGLSSVDSLVMLFPPRIQLVIEALVDLVILVSSFYLVRLSIAFMQRQQLLGHKLGGALGIPIWIVTLALILSMSLMIAFSGLAMLKKMIGSKSS